MALIRGNAGRRAGGERKSVADLPAISNDFREVPGMPDQLNPAIRFTGR